METSFDLMVWRAALAGADPVPDAPTLAEWSALLAGAGQEAAADLLADVAAIVRGAPPQTRGELASAPYPADEPSTVGRALEELRALAAWMGEAGPPRLAVDPGLKPSGRPDNPAGIGNGVPAPPAPGDIAALARSLRAVLEAGEDTGAAEALAAQLREAGRRLPALDHRAYAQAPLALLAPAIATAALMDWALGTRDLCCGPLGSPGLFHAAARLDAAGLGPWFGNVGRLIRDAADLFDLARSAAEAGGRGGDREAVRAWIALLSRGCRGALLREVVDELGDADAGNVMGAILDRVASHLPAAVDTDLVFRIRDAALDNADHSLAARAQRLIVRLRPGSALEMVILGDIEASGGDHHAAEAIFRDLLARSPDDEGLRARLRAARVERFDAFRLDRGYGSPADRQEFRLRRRGLVLGYRRRRGERIEAVDVR